MQTPSQGATASATIILPEEGHVYSQMGSWEARLLMTGGKSEGAWWMGHFPEDPGFMKPGTSEFAAEFQKIAARCDMVSLGPAP